MKRISLAALIAAFFWIAVSAQAPAPVKLKVGDEAPDFTLSDTAGQKVKLSDYRGKNNVVLAFYVFAFTGG